MNAETARTDFCDLDHTAQLVSVAVDSAHPTPTADLPDLSDLDLTDMSDDALAAAAAAGDSAAFGVLAARVSPGLLRYLRRMLPDTQAAEDLAQETLLHAWKGLPDFGFRSSFRTWMFAIAHRKTVDYHRRRRDVPADGDRFADIADPTPLPADQVEHASLVEALRRELSALPATSRAVWWLRDVEGLSLQEIARILRISTGSVRGHLQRSRRYLSVRLAPWKPSAGVTSVERKSNERQGLGEED